MEKGNFWVLKEADDKIQNELNEIVVKKLRTLNGILDEGDMEIIKAHCKHFIDVKFLRNLERTRVLSVGCGDFTRPVMLTNQMKYPINFFFTEKEPYDVLCGVYGDFRGNFDTLLDRGSPVGTDFDCRTMGIDNRLGRFGRVHATCLEANPVVRKELYFKFFMRNEEVLTDHGFYHVILPYEDDPTKNERRLKSLNEKIDCEIDDVKRMKLEQKIERLTRLQGIPEEHCKLYSYGLLEASSKSGLEFVGKVETFNRHRITNRDGQSKFKKFIEYIFVKTKKSEQELIERHAVKSIVAHHGRIIEALILNSDTSMLEENSDMSIFSKYYDCERIVHEMLDNIVKHHKKILEKSEEGCKKLDVNLSFFRFSSLPKKRVFMKGPEGFQEVGTEGSLFWKIYRIWRKRRKNLRLFREYDRFHNLLLSSGQLSRRVLSNIIWGDSDILSYVENHIAEMRFKLGDMSGYINTLYDNRVLQVRIRDSEENLVDLQFLEGQVPETSLRLVSHQMVMEEREKRKLERIEREKEKEKERKERVREREKRRKEKSMRKKLRKKKIKEEKEEEDRVE